ncbi:uncharacterized protein FOMMEDRAFT_154070 [Fomitiporia mediterranea MF3/22]|uniref:uncharacterized protein n=1 Tax=Fomitiporia mediterranea (strain MF3/22) TaxID=694068 RepID=UPI000440936E|nr:uncharacterized protein FOMMEDRAFT_154070 [Fomitiporia mediterranea MF3/22]EJD04919.1 hypothetical protein FOMMEDRAFT_154070 [Fomitiporia mediterranea MF3/22]
MDAVLDKALALRGVTGVLVLTRNSWLTIASRGALTANDAPAIEELLSWAEEESTGSIPWNGGSGGRCLHFHRANTHTLILLRQRAGADSVGTAGGDRLSPSAAGAPRPPRMRFGWSTTSSNSENPFGLRAGSASLFAPSRSIESQNVHRPSSWY